jgi:hypothetical protein
MELLSIVHGIMNLNTHLSVSSTHSLGKWLTVPPIEASCTPSETGRTANLGLGKLISSDVESDSDVESE